jgi:hypothetical protein
MRKIVKYFYVGTKKKKYLQKRGLTELEEPKLEGVAARLTGDWDPEEEARRPDSDPRGFMGEAET